MEKHIVYQDARTIRAFGRGSLKGFWLLALSGAFFVSIISTLPSYFIDGALDGEAIINYIQTGALPDNYAGMGILALYRFLITGPIEFGFYAFIMNILRRTPTGTMQIFAGFADFGKLFLLNALVSLLIGAGSILIVPGFIFMYTYMTVYLVLMDHPEMKPIEAMRACRELMKGNRLKLFVVQIGFVGWYIVLGIIETGLLYIATGLAAVVTVLGEAMILCYMTASVCAFYDMANGRIVENVVNNGR